MAKFMSYLGQIQFATVHCTFTDPVYRIGRGTQGIMI